jgi:hypothetical protein
MQSLDGSNFRVPKKRDGPGVHQQVYIEAEARRKAWFKSERWEFTPNVTVDPKKLPLLSYNTVVDVNGRTEQVEDKHDAFVAFMATPEVRSESVAHGGVRQDDHCSLLSASGRPILPLSCSKTSVSR